MHEYRNTKAIVLKIQTISEADTLAYLVTEEFGLLPAMAKSAKAEKAKFHQILDVGNLLDLTLVRGKTGFKITGATLQRQVGFPEILRSVPQWQEFTHLALNLFGYESQETEIFSFFEQLAQKLPLSEREKNIYILKLLELSGHANSLDFSKIKDEQIRERLIKSLKDAQVSLHDTI